MKQRYMEKIIGKSFLVVGGSSGIGAGVVQVLLSYGSSCVYVADISDPKYCVEELSNGRVKYLYIDLSRDDVQNLSSLPINGLFITAGIGRLNYFNDFTLTEIKKTFNVNTVALSQIVRLYYDRMLENTDFYSFLLCSIAGLISSPLYAVYSATKAAMVKLTEALNTELETSGTQNRILAISPGRVNGTAFHGGKNDFSVLKPFAEELLVRSFDREVLYIPDFCSTYENVLKRYHDDPKKFSIESMTYKLRYSTLEDSKIKIGYLSGTFDLFHIGHLNLLQRARKLCDYLIVGVHGSGAWKGKETFIPLEDRKAIIKSCRYVDKVIDAPDEDNLVWLNFKYDMLFVGSDYKGTDRFLRYEEYFKDKGVKIVYFDYTKGISSTKLREALSTIANESNQKQID